MRFRSNSRIVRGCRLCAALGITLLMGIGAYADSAKKGKRAAPTFGTVVNVGGASQHASGGVCPASSCPDDSLTQSLDPVTDGANQVACGLAGVGTTENVWARCFDLVTEGFAGATTINSVTFGVQQATIDDIPLNVNLYLDLDGCPASGRGTANAPLLASEALVVGTADVGTLITVNFPGTEVAAGSSLIVEIEATADGTEEPLHSFRAMSNDAGQCGGSFLFAADCGDTDWTDLADIGFPDAHLILNIDATAECGPGALGACCGPDGKKGACQADAAQGECLAGGGIWLGGNTPCFLCACETSENECLDGKSGGAGCSDTACCATVCNIAPECCEIEWDISCSGIAQDECPFPPDNDNCADSLPIFLGDTDYDTSDANTDGIAHGLDCALEGQTFHDIWFDHVATCDGILRVTTCEGFGGAASYDTHLVIYTGCDVANCPPGEEDFLGCNDDGPDDDCPGDSSVLEVPVAEGQCYQLRAGGFADGDQGTGTLHLECNPPPDPTGACCLTALGEDCDILTAAACGKVGGEYLGDDEVCSFIEGEQVFEVTGLNLILLDDGGPVSDTITVEGDTVIFDVDVGLTITHSWVGDLRVTLEHNGTTVVLISQPGDPDDLPGGDFGCLEDNYDNIILDDQGTGGNIEDVCEFNLTSPPNYVPFEALAAFNGMSKGGDWTITAEDVEPIGEDEGRFTGWSLHIEGDGQEISNCAAGGGCGDCPPDQGGAKGEVDPVDLAGLLGCWGPKTLPGCECFDADGKNGINPLDLATLLGSWGECPLP